MRSRLLVGILLWCYWLMPALGVAAEAQVEPPTSAELKIANRTITVFRVPLLGEVPELRVKHATVVINEALDSTDSLEVSIDPILNSYLVLIGPRRAFIISPKDVDELQFESVMQAAQGAAENLRLVVAETREARSVQQMLRAALACAVASLLLFGLLWVIFFIRRRLLAALPALMKRHALSLKVGQMPLIDASYLYPLISRVLWFVRWVLVVLLTYQWLGFVLSRFPYTRPWGESLNNYLLSVAQSLFESMIDAVPRLGVVLAIFLIARGFSGFSKSVLRRIAISGVFGWLNEETLQPTTRLTSLAIWLFALAMAYPYLPGAHTEAFKGLSVLIGLMISLGASSVVGQAAAGLILTYTRTLRPGEFVRIGEHEGTVTELGMFTTRIRTGLGEVLTLPNSMITNAVTKNYSRTVQGPGYVVDTTVTIGYDTPWRQVEAMLLEAARRTTGVLEQPPPQVFQTALSDFYPEYRLVAQAIPSQPHPRAELLTLLHANIQDVFNEYGVQIMSPHYLGDPHEAKWVPRDKWYSPPANPDGDHRAP